MKLPETEQEFKEMIWSKSKDAKDKFPIWFQKEFVDYWLEVPDCATKARYFLLPKKDRERWSTLGRMATAKRTIYKGDPRWKSTVPKKENIDRFRPKRLMTDQEKKVMDYQEKLRKNWNAQ